MRLLASLVVGAMFLLPSLPRESDGGDAPFLTPSNAGITGLLETPTARVLPENAIRIGMSEARPYRLYFVTVSPFEGLELSGRITEVTTARENEGAFAGYGNFKDKTADVKYRFVTEGKYLPALALSIHDPHGTRIYAGQALVASKQIYPFDFTVGLGNGRFGKRPLRTKPEGFRIEMIQDPGAFLREAKIFGGIAFAPTEKLSVLAEYSTIDYRARTRDPAAATYFSGRKAPSRINLGLRWRPWPFAELGASLQRGDTLGVHVTTNFEIGRPWIPIYNPPYRIMPGGAAPGTFEERTAEALSESGFSRIRIQRDGMTLRVEAQNDRYFYAPEAVMIAVDTLGEIGIPPEHEYVDFRLAENGIPTARFVTSSRSLDAWRRGDLPTETFLASDRFRTDVADNPDAAVMRARRVRFDAKPTLETFLNDPSGFFKYRLGIKGRSTASLWKGFSLIGGVEAYPANTISTTNTPLSIPVRSDLPLYKKERIALGMLLGEQIVKSSEGIHARMAAGLLEVEYAGVDAEIAAPFLEGRILLGGGGSYARKRDPERPLALKKGFVKDHYGTGFVNARFCVPSREACLDVKAGRFLAGDSGVRLQLSKFINGVVLSGWYGMTDTRAFTDDFNRGYSDKGVSVTIPLRLFLGRDSRTAYEYRLSPWTRDTGQDIEHATSLFDFIGRNVPVYIDKDRRMMYRGK